MKTSQNIKLAQIVLISFILMSQISCRVIWDEHLTKDELQNRVNAFNHWFKSISPNAKLEARLTEDNKVRAFALEDIKVTLITKLDGRNIFFFAYKLYNQRTKHL